MRFKILFFMILINGTTITTAMEQQKQMVEQEFETVMCMPGKYEEFQRNFAYLQSRLLSIGAPFSIDNYAELSQFEKKARQEVETIKKASEILLKKYGAFHKKYPSVAGKELYQKMYAFYESL